MIEGILISYAVLTLPIVLYIVYKVWRRINKPSPLPVAAAATEVQIADVIRACRDTIVAWCVTIRDNQEIAKRDRQAMLQATQAIARSMLDIKDAAKNLTSLPAPEKSVNDFVHSLEYVRDNYAQTSTQKKAVENIISNIRVKHGTESK